MTVLTVEECWDLLRDQQYGRLAVSVADKPNIYPVNYSTDGANLVFRTAPGTKLLELTINKSVAFEIDGYTESTAWSVVVAGTASRLDRQAEIYEAEALPLVPWIPTVKNTWVRITPTQVHGVRFERGPEPEPEPEP